MAQDGSIVISTEIDSKEAQKELNKLNKEIQSLENQLRSKTSGRLPLEENLKEVNARLEEAKKNLAYLQDEQYFINEAMKPGSSPEDYIEASSNREETERNLKEQQVRVEAIQKEWEKANQKLKVYDNQIMETNLKLEEAKSQAGGLQKQMAKATPANNSAGDSASKMGTAMERAKKSAEGFATRLKGVVTSALVFTVVSQGLAKFREWMGKVIQTNDEASSAMARLRGSLLTLAQPLVNVLIPAFTTLVNVLTRIVSVAAQIVSSLFGSTAEQSAEAAENLYNETNAIEDVSGAAKKAEKSLAGFDEINQLSSDSSSGPASAGGSSAGGTAPDFTGPINDSLTGIVELFVGAALLALGAILTFSGAHILLGIGLMILGALAIWDAISTNWQAIQEALQGPIGEIVAIVSGALLALGAVFCFSGVAIPLGIALLAMGAIGLVTAAAANWDSIVTALQGPIGEITTLVSGALLALGAILCLSGVAIPLGIALMVLGAIGLVTVAAVNWNAIVDKVKEILEQIKNAVVSVWNWLDGFTHGFLSDIFGAFGEIFGGIIDLIAGVFSGDWQRAWNGIVSIFKGIWDGLVAIVKAPINAIIGLINGVIDAINWIIGGINSISFDLPDWLGGMHIGFNIGTIGHIPYLAQGAVIPPNQEFLAVLGDQRRGNNIEAPEGLLRQLIREESGGSEIVLLLQAILEATKAGKKLYVDKKVLAQTAKDGINDMTIAAGKSVLLY
jgi:predicted  nucleic acid-binding Zn-ribbon protein